MYNPDAVAEWIYRKYPAFFRWVDEHSEPDLPEELNIVHRYQIYPKK